MVAALVGVVLHLVAICWKRKWKHDVARRFHLRLVRFVCGGLVVMMAVLTRIDLVLKFPKAAQREFGVVHWLLLVYRARPMAVFKTVRKLVWVITAIVVAHV